MLKIEKFSCVDLYEVEKISAEQFGANGWGLKLFEEELDKHEHFAFVGKTENGKVVCFLFAVRTFGVEGEDINILNIATKRGYENLGYASELLAFLQTEAKKNNISSIWLEVRESNLHAIKFYQNLGLKVDYIRKHYYSNGENALVMSVRF